MNALLHYRLLATLIRSVIGGLIFRDLRDGAFWSWESFYRSCTRLLTFGIDSFLVDKILEHIQFVVFFNLWDEDIGFSDTS